MPRPSATVQAQVVDAVEQMGFGHAQVRVLFLAYGVWLVESVQITGAALLDATMSRELGFGLYQRASFTSLLFGGIMVGCLSSGFLGDKAGRRPPVVASLAIAGVAQVAVSIATSYRQVVLLRWLIGFANGLGMASSLALVFESSPQSTRTLLMASRMVMFSVGGIIATIPVLLDSPSLHGLHWRAQSALVALVPLIWAAFAVPLLQESPVFLASMGQQESALKVLRSMRDLNGTPDVDLSGFRPVPATLASVVSRSKSNSFLNGISASFANEKFALMMTLIVGTSTMNAVAYGHFYAFPKINFGDTSFDWLPGYEVLMQQVVALLINLFILGLANVMKCRSMLVAATVVGIIGLPAFIWTARLSLDSVVGEWSYLVMQNVPNLVQSLGFLACYQLSLDLFHSRYRATSAAICIAAGRISAMLAPFMFEALPHWEHFYYMMVCMCMATLVMAVWFLPDGLLPQDTDEPLCKKANV